MTKIVKYDNKINSLNFEKFTSNDFDFFFGICHAMQEKGTEEVTLTFSQIAKLVSYKETDKKRFVYDIERMYDKVEEIKYRYEDNERIVKFRLFNRFEAIKETEEVKIQVDEEFACLLNNLKEQFTLFELQQFVQLNSKHTKTLFRICKQWRTNGETKFYSVEELKKIFDCENYDTKNFTRLIKKSTKELAEKEIFTNLICVPKTGNKRGLPVVGYVFTFEAEQPRNNIELNKSTPKNNESKPKQVKAMTKSAEAYNNYPQRQHSQEYWDDLEQQLLALAVQQNE